MPGIGRQAPRLETRPSASVLLAIYTEPCQVPCRHSISIPTNRPLDTSHRTLPARRTKSVTVRAAYARSERRACPPPRKHQTRIFQAPSAARRPRTRPLRPVEHRNRPRSASELQRCPLQNCVRASAPRTAGRPRGMRSLRDGEEQQAGPPARSEQATRVRHRRRPGCSRAQRHLRGQRRRARAPNSARRAAGSIPRAQVGHAPHHLDRGPLVPRQPRRPPPSVGPIFYFQKNHLRDSLVLP